MSIRPETKTLSWDSKEGNKIIFQWGERSQRWDNCEDCQLRGKKGPSWDH